MCGEAEFGKCDCCGKETIVSRKYYHYNINIIAFIPDYIRV